MKKERGSMQIKAEKAGFDWSVQGKPISIW